MAVSQNGWPVYANGTHPDLTAIPRVAGRVRKGDVATIFTYLIDRFDHEVEDVDEARGQPNDDWGWAGRPIRGASVTPSNHSSGTAVDLNATRHPLGKRSTFTKKQVAAIHSILADLDGVVRWGGDYNGRPDEMHFEINKDARAVALAAAAIRIGDDMTPKELRKALAPELSAIRTMDARTRLGFDLVFKKLNVAQADIDKIEADVETLIKEG